MSTRRTPARLNGHDGTLVKQEDATLLWQGELDEQLMAALMRIGSERSVRLDGDALGDRRAVVQRCWYDLERGRLVVQLRAPSMSA